MKKKLSVVVCLVLIISMMTGCTTFNNFRDAFFSDGNTTKADDGERTIKIGVYEPLTGSYKSAGEEEKIGIELAHELYPEVLGKKVELIYGDNQGDMYVAETVIAEMVGKSPTVILGSYGDTVTLVAGETVQEAQIPSITMTGSNSLITINNPYYFSATFSETKQGYALANYVFKDCGIKQAAVVRVSGDDTVVATAQRFVNKFNRMAGEDGGIVGNYQLDAEATDFTDTIKQIKKSGAQAVFLAVSPLKAEAFLKQVEEAGLTNVLYVGTKAWNDEDFIKFIDESKAFDVAYTTDYAVAAEESEMSKQFIEAYKYKYGQNAEPTEAMAIAFDGYLLAINAIENAYNEIMATDFEKLEADSNVTPEQLEKIRANWLETNQKGIPTGELIKDALMKIANFEGASGTISFDGTNEANKSIVVNRNTKGVAKNPVVEQNDEIVAGADDAQKSDKDVAAEASK